MTLLAIWIGRGIFRPFNLITIRVVIINYHLSRCTFLESYVNSSLLISFCMKEYLHRVRTKRFIFYPLGVFRLDFSFSMPGSKLWCRLFRYCSYHVFDLTVNHHFAGFCYRILRNMLWVVLLNSSMGKRSIIFSFRLVNYVVFFPFEVTSRVMLMVVFLGFCGDMRPSPLVPYGCFFWEKLTCWA